MKIPATLRAGDTWAWTDTQSDYPAATYTLKYSLRAYGLEPVDIVAVGSGNDHVSTVTAAITGSIPPGTYQWVAYVERTVAGVLERTTLSSGSLVVQANLLAATSTTDIRSVAEVLLDNLETAIRRLSTREVETLTVNGRTVTYRQLGGLLKDRESLRMEVNKEREAAKLAAGLASGRRILTEFVNG